MFFFSSFVDPGNGGRFLRLFNIILQLITFHSIPLLYVLVKHIILYIYIPYTYYHKYNHVYHFSSSGVLQRPAKDYDATNAAIRQGQQIIGKESENQSPNEGDNMTSPVIGKEDKNGQI